MKINAKCIYCNRKIRAGSVTWATTTSKGYAHMSCHIAKLAHSQQPCKTNGEESHNLSKRNCSTPSADTHIPKESK